MMKNNPEAPETPCHRVVASDGRIGGYMGERSGKEVERKIVMLRNEGVEVRGGKVDLERYRFIF
jgi:alkylated DNA nucleotide flippase Atl1